MKECVDLGAGIQMPVIGFGTWKAQDGQECYEAVLTALQIGYRHIDTASIYGNEESVGRAIRDSGLAREEIFVTTKLWNTAHTYDQALEALNDSLDRLGLDYVDLYLIHWPNPLSLRDHWKERNAEVWRAMEDALGMGKVSAIGVSNFMVHHLDALLEIARIKPVVNQIRLSPGILQDDIVAYCRQLGIILEAYTPFGDGEVFTNPIVKEMATRYQMPVANLVLAWSLQHGFVPLPKSVTPSRILSNFEKYDVCLSEHDMAILDKLSVTVTAPNPDTVDF